ncbi:MAG: Fe-S cluster assembly protein HesB [Methanoregulaceae archaeon]|jgi:endonuclease-3 related protein
MSVSTSVRIARIIQYLDAKYGKIDWWQGDIDEVLIGAILTQQTRWENVERALKELKRQGLCSIEAISLTNKKSVQMAIRSNGFYRIKTERLKSLASFVMGRYGGIEGMARESTRGLRKNLLEISGIGEETADSILCYGFQRTSFVIDAYTERICKCLGLNEKRSEYKKLFEKVLPLSALSYQLTHAHIVEYAKEYCGKKRCGECSLKILNE